MKRVCLHNMSHLSVGIQVGGILTNNSHWCEMNASGVKSICVWTEGGGKHIIAMFTVGRDFIGYAPIWDDDAIGLFSYHVSKAYKRHWFWNKHLESLYLLDLCIYNGIEEREKDSSQKIDSKSLSTQERSCQGR